MVEDNFDMDIEILEVYELNEQLRIKVRHCYGEDVLGLSIKKKALDPFTDKPLWLTEVYELLKKKYAPKTKSPIQIENEFVGKVVSLKDFKKKKVSGWHKRLKTSLGMTNEEISEIQKEFKDPIELRQHIMAGKSVNQKSKIKNKLIKYYGGTGLGFDSDERPEIIELKKQGKLDKLGNSLEVKNVKKTIKD